MVLKEPPVASKLKSPADMFEAIARRLKDTTGRSLEEWTEALRAAGLADVDAAAKWLQAQGVTGGRARTIAQHVFGLPDWATASGEALVDGQYAGAKAALRPVYERVVALASALGASVEPRKTYTTLSTPKRQFAIVQATTRARVDLGLRLGGTPPEGRLEPAKGLGNEYINRRFALTTPDQVDAEVEAWLKRAYDLNA